MYLVQHYGFGDVSQPSPVGSPGERRWLLGFAVASTGYRMVLTLGIALFLAARYPLVGGLLGAWSFGMLLVWPMVKGLSHLTRSSRLAGRRSRALLAVVLLAGVPALALFGVALPYGSWALGVVQLPDATMLHAGTDGIVTRVFATPGSFVHRGDPIVELEEPALPAALAVLQAQRAELRLREDAVLLTDRVSAELLRAGVHRADAAVAMARIRLAEQTIRAPRDGTLVLPEAEDLPGHFIRRGDLLGYVLAAGDVIVRVAVPQDRIDLVRRRTQGVELRLAHSVFRPVTASIQRELPGAVARCRARRSGLPRVVRSRPTPPMPPACGRSSRPSWSMWSRPASMHAISGSASASMSVSTTDQSRWRGGCCVGCASCFFGASMSEAVLPAWSETVLPALWRYPERADAERGPLDEWLRCRAGGMLRRAGAGVRRRRLAAFARVVTEAGVEPPQLDDAALAAAARSAGIALRRRASDRVALVRLFALVREAATRALGIRPHDNQVMAAAALWRGSIAEMATGEGKTASPRLLRRRRGTGRPRRCMSSRSTTIWPGAMPRLMAPLYQLLGLTVAALAGGMPPQHRRAAYAAAIVYGTTKEVVFDYLRDRLALGRIAAPCGCKAGAISAATRHALLMRGLDFAIVDEADSVLVDEARTPLILSGEQDSQVDEATAAQALALAGRLVIGRDWRSLSRRLVVELTEAGETRLETLIEADRCRPAPGPIAGPVVDAARARGTGAPRAGRAAPVPSRRALPGARRPDPDHRRIQRPDHA